MRARIILPALLCAGIGLAMLLPSAATPPANSERIEKLIADLGSARFDEREKASRELEAIGKPALEALRKAARSGDPEAKRRADELVKKMESRQNNEKILAATKIRLRFKDTPILEAIAELHKQTGFLISYVDDPAKLKGRTITLDTGETTFWQAFDLFCQKAGVVEGQVPPNPNQPVAAPVGAPAPQPAARPVAQALPPNTIAPVSGPYRHYVNLLNGPPRKLPTDYVGTMRVRILPPEMELSNAPPRLDKEVRVVLDLSPEPRVEFQRVLDLRIDRAVDEKGQSLTAFKTAAANANAPANAAGLGASRTLPTRQMPVRLVAAAQPSRQLKELKGAITAMIRTPPQVMATVDDLLNASGKSVKGEYGITIGVKEVKKLNDGAVQLQVTLERPTDVYGYIPPSTAGAAAPASGGPLQIQPIKQQGAIQIKAIQVKPLPVRPAAQPVPPQPVPPQALPPNPAPVQQQAPNPAPQPGQPQVQPVPPQPGQPQVLPVPPQPGKPQQGVVSRPATVAFVGLSVHDAKDQRLQLTVERTQNRLANGVYTYEITLTAKPQAGQGGPARLVFTGTRNVTVEVPFTLKDVPLP